MTVYLLNLFSIPLYALLLYLVDIDSRKKKRILCGLVGVQLFLTAALRATTVGGDLENYIPAYEYISQSSWDKLLFVPFETGYVVLNKILSLMTPEVRLLLVFISGFIVFGYIRSIYRNSTIPWLSLFLFIAMGFFTESLSMLRQSIAMVVILGGLKYVEERHFGKYLLIVILAMTFHLTAVVMLILYPFSRVKLNLKNFILLITGCGLFMLTLGRSILNYVISNFYSLYSSKIESGSGFSMLLLLLAIAVGGLLLNSPNRSPKVYMSMIALACCMQLFALQFALFARIVMYFSMASVIYIPETLSRIQNKEIRLMMILLVCVLAAMYFIFLILERNAAGIMPYQFM